MRGRGPRIVRLPPARVEAIALQAAIALLVAACGIATPSRAPSQAAVQPSPSPAATPVPSGSMSPGPASPVGPSPSSAAASPRPGLPVEDPALLAVLPAEIDGNRVVLESEAFAEAVTDPGFAANVESAAFGVVVADPDLASAVVAVPAEGAFSEGWFRGWRDAYNAGACAQAGGIAGNAEAELGGRRVYIGSCAGGLRTYHTWIEDRGLLVSAFSVGDGRFGERLLSGLRPSW